MHNAGQLMHINTHQTLHSDLFCIHPKNCVRDHPIVLTVKHFCSQENHEIKPNLAIKCNCQETKVLNMLHIKITY